jgi:serine/threonine-protein kinase
MLSAQSIRMTNMPTVILSRTAAGLASLGRRVEVPARLGSVVLLRPLGEGGMSVVHLARHEVLNQHVAVKFLLDVPGSEEDPRFTAFIEGARAAAAVRHPGLNILHHADATEGVPYLVMEYIEGPTLAEVVRKHGPLPAHLARTAIECVAGALGELHSHAIIHRDVKPANIMIDPTGRVVVTDFGLAMQRPGPVFGAQAGIAGTPSYMAPEMFEGTVSTRTDVYALGVTMFELLTGAPPFAGDFDALRLAHRVNRLPVDLLAARGVPEEIIVLIERAMHKDVLYRPKSAHHVLDAFSKACEAAAITRATDTQMQRFLEIGRGTPTPAGVAKDTPTPAYYERLGTLAGQKRRSDSGSRTPGDAPATPEAAPALELTPAPAASESAPPAAAARRALLPAIVPGVAIAVGSVFGSLACAALYHPAAWVRARMVLAFDRMGWVDHGVDAQIAAGARIITGRLPSALGVLVDAVQLGIFIALPTLVLWSLYTRLVLARPRLDGVTRCAWCGHPRAGARDLRCHECGRLAGAVPTPTDIPPARQRAARLACALAAAGTLGVLLAGGAATYYRSLGTVFGAKPTALSIQGVAGMMVLLVPAIAGSLVVLHFVARRSAPLTGITRCGSCGTSLEGITSPACPACARPV